MSHRITHQYILLLINTPLTLARYLMMALCAGKSGLRNFDVHRNSGEARVCKQQRRGLLRQFFGHSTMNSGYDLFMIISDSNTVWKPID